MGTKKKPEKLTPIPRPRRRKLPSSESCSPSSQAEAAPDLSYIAPGLRSYAVPIGEVAFLRDNPRRHTEKDLAQTQASLREFGQVELLVVNRRENPPVVLNGNGRLQGALGLGWSHIAVHYVDLPADRAAALAVTLNRTGELAGWDTAVLDQLLGDIEAIQLADPTLDEMLADLVDKTRPSGRARGDATESTDPASAAEGDASTSEASQANEPREPGAAKVCPHCGAALPPASDL